MFTLGNVITLALCVALVLIFRQVDANNKSIDKVKKFTDKLKTDLDAYFDGRNRSLQEAAVDLETKQTLAIAAVNRLKKFEEDFGNRSQETEQRILSLSDVEKRIDNYDVIIKNLIEMTGRAEENLQHLSAQSKHFDAAFKKIKDLQDKITQIDNAIPGLTEQFIQKNEEQLSSIGTNLLDVYTAKTEAFAQQYDVYAKKCTKLYESIDLHINESFESAARKAEVLENAVFSQLQEKSKQRSDEYLASVDKKNVAIRQNVEMQIASAQELVKNFRAETGVEMSAYEESVRADMQNVSSKFQNMVQTIDTRIADFERTTANRIEDFDARIDKNDQRLEMTFSETESKINVFKDDIRQNIKEAEAAMEDMKGEVSARAADLESNFAALEGKLQSTADEKIREIENALHGQMADIEHQMVSFYDEISGNLETKNTELFSEISTRFEAYKTDVQYRFKSFEKYSFDISQIDEQLRRAMEDVKSSIIADFESFSHEQRIKQESFSKSVQDDTVALSQGLQTVEQELNILKSQATTNVSEKLKLFESDFYKDLDKKSEFVADAFQNWTENMDEKLNLMASKSEDERHSVEVHYTEEMKERLAEFAEHYKGYSVRYEEQLQAVSGSIQEKLALYEQSLHEYTEQAQQALNAAKSSTDEHIKNQIETQASEIRELLGKQERDLTSQIKEAFADVETTREKTEASLESVKTDFATWRERLMQQFTESKTAFEEKLEGLKSNSEELINQVGNSFNVDVENYAAKVREEKDRIVNELDKLRSQMDQTLGSYDTRAEEMLEQFKKSYETMLEETSQKIREQNLDSEQKLRALKTLVQEIRDNIEATKEKMFLKMQSDANALNLTMDDVGKRLNGFVAQTQLFDKADELKNHLETEIGGLKTEISRIESFRQVAGDLEQQFIKIRRMEEEVNQKLGKFSAEKKRIEVIENDFNTLMTMSTNMDQKISELKTANDDLQTLQLAIRRYQEGLNEISGRYDRLEKKNAVLEQTMSGVDRSFESLQQIEKRIAVCNSEVQKFPEQVIDIKQSVDKLMDGNSRVNEAVEKLSSLEVILKDTFDRIEEMKKAREWLARTETRMNEIQKQADDQVKLMGDMLKNDSSRSNVSSDAGAPPVGQRETVVKLAKSGWTVDEIAKRMHMSLGEVELILEYNTGVK